MRIKPYYYKRVCRELNDYKIHAQAIKDAAEKLEEMERDIDTGLGAISYDKDRVQGGTGDSVIENIVISRQELISYYQNIIKHRSRKKAMIDRGFELLEEVERLIIIYKYCDRRTWAQIQEKVNYSRRQCARYRDSGLGRLALYLYGEDCRQIE